MLKDRFGRVVNYLRISVTDRCDFRCVYCMSEDMQFLPRAQLLTLEEIATVARAFVELGVSKIRLTGGEPLVRHNVLWLCEELGAMPGLKELVLTTNGSQLHKMAGSLKSAGVRRLNVSIDTLDAERFRELTRVGDLDTVLKGIESARAQGFERIKLNCVVLKGRNDHEILDLVEYAAAGGLDISFIEEMPLGRISEHDRARTHMSSEEIRRHIESRHALIPSTESTGGPSRYFRLAGSDSRIGFISPLSHNFCGSCNRVRLTAEGRLLLCLGNEHSLDLRRVVRAHPGDTEALKSAILAAMELKPERHHFDVASDVQILRFMSMTGG
ncbi:MAG: GTP 3',8-cyclase MoaA [Gammaproteobacteria bacterium]|nr:GTP 3',8-cyclase MoaA [Gammaproteobacteria bacterium]